jgi:hypothetical protein
MIFRASPRRRAVLIVLAMSTLVALVAAHLNTSDRQVAAAGTHVMIDYPDTSIVQRLALSQHFSGLQKRAEFYGQLMVTTPVLERIARRAGIPADQISAVARTTVSVPRPLTEPGSEERASQIRDSRLPYRLDLQSDALEPVLAVYAQAPTTEEAERLADMSILGLRDFLAAQAKREGVPDRVLPRLRPLEKARGGPISGRAPLAIGVLTFMVAFAITAAAGLALVYRRRPSAAGPAPAGDDDWPNTTRVLPWMIAAFIAMLWLVPFNSIELAVSAPIDLKLDRLVMPFLAGAWVLAMLAGGRMAPRLRITPIHMAIAAFVACAFLSVVLNAGHLNQTLELDLSFKKLPVLVAYVAFFLIVASSVRPTEVRAFMTLTVGLAVVCSVGIVWEYRMHQNLFQAWSDQLLPGIFRVLDSASIVGVDSLGRRGIAGPGDVGLEAVTMLSMALPIVLVRLIGSRRPNERVLYGIAACLLVAAIFATGRKSALLAPLAVLLTLAYFRRRELLSLAPLGLVIAVVVSLLSPGAVRGTIDQFLRPDSASVATTADRTADYDAVRPDLWTNLLLGRGHGSYNHESYRIIDSEILNRLIETGVLGLLAFVAVGLSVLFVARSTIAARDPTYSPPALVGAAVAVCFLTVATLFDLLGYPHAVYIFLYMAGLVAVVVGREREPEPEASRGDPAHEGRVRLPSLEVPQILRR